MAVLRAAFLLGLLSVVNGNLHGFRSKSKEIVYVVSGGPNYGGNGERTFDNPIQDIVAFTGKQFNLRKTTFGVLWANAENNIQMVSPMTNDVQKAELMMTAFLDNRPAPKSPVLSGLTGSIEFAMHNMFSQDRESIKVLVALTHWKMQKSDIEQFLSWSCNRLVIFVLAFPWPYEKCSFGQIQAVVRFMNKKLNSTGFLEANMANCGRNFEVLENFQQLLYDVWPAHENLVNWCDIYQPVTTTESNSDSFFGSNCEGFFCFRAPLVATASAPIALSILLLCYFVIVPIVLKNFETKEEDEELRVASASELFALDNPLLSQGTLDSQPMPTENGIDGEAVKPPDEQASVAENSNAIDESNNNEVANVTEEKQPDAQPYNMATIPPLPFAVPKRPLERKSSNPKTPRTPDHDKSGQTTPRRHVAAQAGSPRLPKPDIKRSQSLRRHNSHRKGARKHGLHAQLGLSVSDSEPHILGLMNSLQVPGVPGLGSHISVHRGKQETPVTSSSILNEQTLAVPVAVAGVKAPHMQSQGDLRHNSLTPRGSLRKRSGSHVAPGKHGGSARRGRKT